jgi:hypothetical protein
MLHELIKGNFIQAYSTCASDEQTHCVCVYVCVCKRAGGGIETSRLQVIFRNELETLVHSGRWPAIKWTLCPLPILCVCMYLYLRQCMCVCISVCVMCECFVCVCVCVPVCVCVCECAWHGYSDACIIIHVSLTNNWGRGNLQIVS